MPFGFSFFYTFFNTAKPLVSIRKNCDDDYTAIFTEEKCYVLKNAHIDVSQFSDKSFKQENEIQKQNYDWAFNLQHSTPNATSNTVYEMKTKELIHFQHKALFSPTKNTWLQAIKCFFRRKAI